MDKKITALIIMDGYGLSNQEEGNAIGVNCSPYVHYLMTHYPTTTLDASGLAVGLPEGQMGNSEVCKSRVFNRYRGGKKERR